jgi:hypothetical protein
MEACVGCGAEAEKHPIAAVVRDEPQWKSVPVCDPCWRDPAHRKAPIKGHFFLRTDAGVAVRLAGSANLSMGG